MMKGDVRLRGVVRVECKTTANKSFSVTKEIVDKLEAACFGAGEIPLIQVEICSGAHRLIVMPDWALDLIMEAMRSRNEPSE